MIADVLQKPKLVRQGFSVGGETLPLYAGSAHYFRLPRNVWERALESLRALGARFVDVAVPWSIHEKSKGDFDFGENNPRLDLVAFVELAASVGLSTIVRVGPMLAAELTGDGVPERVLWDEACMARSGTGAPLVRASLPVAHPTPSLASRAFHDEAALFLRAVAERLAPFSTAGGPLALVIVGDERRAGFVAPGAARGDFHPDAIAQYRRFLRHRYGSLGALRRVHGAEATFDALDPPRDLPPSDPERLGPHLDWAEAQEAILEGALYRYRAVLDRHGLAGVTKIYEQMDDGGPSLIDANRLERITNGVSFEHRGAPSEPGRRAIARVVTRATERAASRDEPSFASRVYAGFAPDMAPRSDADDFFVAMTALAYGARGLGLHEAVQRDRWIGGPIDAHGKPRPSAERWERLFAALTRIGHAGLTRRVAVRIALPRSLERLTALSSATAPFTGAAFGASGVSPLLEGEADPTRGAVLEAAEFVTTLERVLDRGRIPYGFAAADGLEKSLGAAAWTIVVCPGALDPVLVGAIGQHAFLGKAISVGPRPPERDAHFLPMPARLPAIQNAIAPLVLPRGPATLAELVTTTLDDLGVASLPAEPDGIRTTLHVDSDGRPRALFVINPGEDDTHAHVAAPGASSARDALSGDDVAVTDGHLSLALGARTVRLLALAPAL
jgi:beta-galactosidase